MNIAKMQKLNEMATHLQQHNIVSTKEEAFAHAEKLYGAQHNFANNNAQHKRSQSDMEKHVRKLMFAMRDVVNELNETKLQVDKLNREINDMRVNNRPRKSTVQKPAQIAKQAPKTAAPVQQPQQQELSQVLSPQNDPNQPIDRNRISPADVSVEKYFYFGQK